MNLRKALIFLTILAVGLTLSGCGKTASGGGGGGGGYSYQRSGDTVETIEGLLDALTKVDDIIISENVEIAITENVALQIPAGKTLTVAKGATLNFNDYSVPDIIGAVIVKTGGAYMDASNLTAGGDSGALDNGGKVILEAGANGWQVISGSLIKMLGGENDADAVLQLSSGNLTIAKSPNGVLNGEAKVNKDFKIGPDENWEIADNGTLTLTAGKNLIIQNGGELHVNGKFNIYGTYAATDVSEDWHSGADSGTIACYYGATSKTNGVTRLASDDSATVLKLSAGAIFEMTKNSYTVSAGIVECKIPYDIGDDQGVKTITVKRDATLKLVNNLNVRNNGTLIVEEDGAVNPENKVVKKPGGTVIGLSGYSE
jgi:hypothetical protein